MRLTSIVDVFKRCEESGSEREVVISFNDESPKPIGRLTVWRPADGGTAMLSIRTEEDICTCEVVTDEGNGQRGHKTGCPVLTSARDQPTQEKPEGSDTCLRCGHSLKMHQPGIESVGGYCYCVVIDSEGPCTCEGFRKS